MTRRRTRSRSRDGLFTWTPDGDTQAAEIADKPPQPHLPRLRSTSRPRLHRTHPPPHPHARLPPRPQTTPGVPMRPAWNQRATVEEVAAAYRETGSVWKAGKKLGLAGQTIHERLRAIGHPMASRVWTREETDELRRLVDNGVPLAEIAHRLGRTYAGVACRASRASTHSTPKRTKKLPRGAGFDKATVNQHLRVLEQTGVKITQYARAHGLTVDTLVQALQQHYAERWSSYIATHSPIPRKACEYCEIEYVPANGKQRYCTRICGGRARADRSYFGGNRRHTIGLADGVCQLCGRQDAKGLSSHHVLGKENDPLNSDLVALCPGCHQIVTLLGGRAFVDDPRAWEALIALAWMRRHGAEIHANPVPQVVYTEVCIEVQDDDEDQDAEHGETPGCHITISEAP